MKKVIVSGFFNPLHGGHLDMLEAASKLGDYLIVVVNNDQQALLKKGKIILDQENRMRLVCALRDVDEVLLSVDTDPTIIQSLKRIKDVYKEDSLIFANGGDRDGERAIPESDICHELGIDLEFGVGSHEIVKRDSSTRINTDSGTEGMVCIKCQTAT